MVFVVPIPPHLFLRPPLPRPILATLQYDPRASFSNPTGNYFERKSVAAKLLYQVMGPVDGHAARGVIRVLLYRLFR